MSIRFKLNSDVPIYFKTNLFISNNYEYMNGSKAKALVQINPDGACYYDINRGQVRVASTIRQARIIGRTAFEIIGNVT